MDFANICEECYEANRSLPSTGLVDLTFGNVSVLDVEQGVFAIKPSGVPYVDLSPRDMVVVELESGRVVEGKLKPSSDEPTHRMLLAAWGASSGVRSIVHTHSRNAVAFAQAGRGIPCLGTTHADTFYGEVPVTRLMAAEEISTEYEGNTGKVILERFQELDPLEIPAVLVYGHGPFAWGASGKKSLETAIALEIVAELALKTIQLNPDVSPLDRKLLDKHFLRKHGPGAYYGQSE